MAQNGVRDVDSLQDALGSSSTKWRTAELHTLHEQLLGKETQNISLVLQLLFQTYAYYRDRPSRRAVQQCLRAVASTKQYHGALLQLVATLKKEAEKPTIAPANAFVLTEWFSVLLEQLSEDNAKQEWYLDIIKADARVLNTCLGSSAKETIRHGALVVTRRGLRKLFRSEAYGPESAREIITALTSKGPQAATNAPMLGVVAGVASRLRPLEKVVEGQKKDYYSFYVREILGSRIPLPRHVGDGLHDFFASFTTADDFRDELVPAFEKALLRAPEIVLNDLIAPVILSLDSSIDLSQVLQANLIKPLMSNLKSTNATIRDGVLRTFKALASRSHGDGQIEKVAAELLTPLKQGKVTSVDQRILHAQMIEALHGTKSLAGKVVSDLAVVVLKEANENVVLAETRAIAKHIELGVRLGEVPNAQTIDLFVKGTCEKRANIRRLWSLRAGDILWNLSLKQPLPQQILPFASSVLEKLLEAWKDAADNPLPAIQSGLITPAYVATAFCLTTLRETHESRIQSIIKKASVSERTLIVEPKPSFLLNPRVYSKLITEDDYIWCARALASVASELPAHLEASPICAAWGEAFLFMIAAAASPHGARREAAHLLSEANSSESSKVTDSVIAGLWRWVRSNELEEKDSPAMTAKTGCDRLHLAVEAICLPSSQETHTKTNAKNIKDKLVRLLVLLRPEVIPHVTWIDTCLKTGTDPGELVDRNADECFGEIIKYTEDPKMTSPLISRAASNAAADLAFVAPAAIIPRLIQQFTKDLDPELLRTIGPTEAAIFRTPEGTAFIDVLSSKAQSNILDKTSKDYDTLKWEQELRAQIAAKKGQTKKLTAEEQKKVNDQLAKEAKIRSTVSVVQAQARRGIGIIQSLATGPTTEAAEWMGSAVKALLEAISAGVGLIAEDAAVVAYLALSDRLSSRLGVTRPFVGVATLRALGTGQLPANLAQESLGDLVTRVMYRLRFMGEQRPFDTVSLAYMLPLAFEILAQGGIEKPADEEADEQIILALEFLSFHTDACTDPRLPREQLLTLLVSSLQKYPQHYRALRDCLLDLCRSIAGNISPREVGVLLSGTIVPQVPVRTCTLQAIDSELDLTHLEFCKEIWLAYHDDVQENVALAKSIWDENDLDTNDSATETGAGTNVREILPYLGSIDRQLRRAASRAVADLVSRQPELFRDVLESLEGEYTEKAKEKKLERDKYGMMKKTDLSDPWEAREGIGLAFRELAPSFDPESIVPFVRFLVRNGPLGDRNARVRDQMVEAASIIVSEKAHSNVEELMQLFESTLEAPDSGSQFQDQVNEAVIVLYGAVARHLAPSDPKLPKVIIRLLATLSTPSETVQYATSQCLQPLARASIQDFSGYVQQMMDQLLNSKKFAERRGAAYGLAGLVQGKGISALRDCRIMSTLKGAAEEKKDANKRQGAFLAYELFSLILGRIFEPYVIQIVPQLLVGFGDPSTDVRDACLDAAKTCFANLSSYGVQQILPTLLEGLDEQQWRSKKGACDSLGAMAYLDPQQLALSLPEIIPPLTGVLNDSHKEVRASANRSLKRFGEVIENPEIKSLVDILLKALSDPTKYTDDALDALLKVSFVHYLDAPSLALVVRILERGLGDRSATKRKSAQIIGSLAHLAERKDLISHLPILVAGLRIAAVDPVPTTRATASKALGSLVEKLGEDALPDLIPSLMSTLKSDTGAGDRLGSAQALSEVLAGLGTTRLEETLPTILQNVSSSKSAVREGFMSLFIFLPACFGNSFANYLSRIIPPILGGLADDLESIRETSLRAGRLLVKNFATRAIDLLLPELERGMGDDSYRIRLSSVELVGDLLFNLTGINAKADQEDNEEGANQAGQSLLEVLGEERRNRVLSMLYICRCDTSGLVRTAAINVWKALVASPRTLRELIPTMTQVIIRRLGSSNMEQKVIAGNALGELIRKAGEGVLTTLLPTLEEGLQTSVDGDAKQGICIALRELIASASPETLEDHEKTLISVVRTALGDTNSEVREAAAEAFDALQQVFGKKAVDQVLPHLLTMLRSEDDAENALSALLTLLTDHARSNIILPNLLPTLLKPPITVFNAKALASLAEVASSAMVRRLPNVLNSLMDNIVTCKDPGMQAELDSSFDTIILSVDEFDGLNTMMSVMLALTKHDDHRKRASADMHFAKFFAQAEIDFSRYHPDLIRILLISFDDSDKDVVKAAHAALTALTGRLRKEEMESLVFSTRQVLQQVGVAGANLPGFSLPKGISAILPIFLQGLMNGTSEQRTQAALAISDIIDRTNPDGLKPFVTQITGPLIRVVSERSVEVKAAILLTLNNLLEKIPTFLKPFLPQLQRTFAKSLADTSSDVLRQRAAKALGTLITLAPRIDPLIAELVTGSKTSDSGVKNAMINALYQVVSKAGANMNDASRNSILGLIDTGVGNGEDDMAITNARLLGALVKNLPPETANPVVKSRAFPPNFTNSSVFALNSILLEAPEALTGPFAEETPAIICKGIATNKAIIADNCVLAAGKFLLTPSSDKSKPTTTSILEALATAIAPGHPIDTRRLALVVVRTVARFHLATVDAHLPLLAPPVFASVRDPVIPVKLAAEAAFLAIFDIVERESEVFDAYLAGPAGQGLQPGQKKSMQDYVKRVAMRLGAQARERREAEGGQGGLGLSSDELEDEREVWSVGKVDLGEGAFDEG